MILSIDSTALHRLVATSILTILPLSHGGWRASISANISSSHSTIQRRYVGLDSSVYLSTYTCSKRIIWYHSPCAISLSPPSALGTLGGRSWCSHWWGAWPISAMWDRTLAIFISESLNSFARSAGKSEELRESESIHSAASFRQLQSKQRRGKFLWLSYVVTEQRELTAEVAVLVSEILYHSRSWPIMDSAFFISSTSNLFLS